MALIWQRTVLDVYTGPGHGSGPVFQSVYSLVELKTLQNDAVVTSLSRLETLPDKTPTCDIED